MNPAPPVLLPSDLDSSLALLDDREFGRLLEEEARRHRNKSLGDAAEAPTRSKRSSDTVTPAKANLVRAAMKAGVKPSAIARQFGLSNAAISDVLRSKDK